MCGMQLQERQQEALNKLTQQFMHQQQQQQQRSQVCRIYDGPRRHVCKGETCNQ